MYSFLSLLTFLSLFRLLFFRMLYISNIGLIRRLLIKHLVSRGYIKEIGVIVNEELIHYEGRVVVFFGCGSVHDLSGVGSFEDGFLWFLHSGQTGHGTGTDTHATVYPGQGSSSTRPPAPWRTDVSPIASSLSACRSSHVSTVRLAVAEALALLDRVANLEALLLELTLLGRGRTLALDARLQLRLEILPRHLMLEALLLELATPLLELGLEDLSIEFGLGGLEEGLCQLLVLAVSRR
mmetsp:Transcript_35413/g.89429  ORF Transcript_35413/g.89429 Transcript_35413/m.89429 type:complete len:238 (-) Transcript_35413:964-1677(-)